MQRLCIHNNQLTLFAFLYLISVLIVLGVPSESPAEEAIEFDRITSKHGLTHGVVYYIIQDSREFMWFGGEGGLNRFDGYTFNAYQHDPLNPNSLSNNDVSTMFEDKDGIFWIGTWGGGVNRFNPITEQFTHYKNDPQDPNSLTDNRVQRVFQDRSGNIWFGTYRGGLNKFDPVKREFLAHYQHDPDNPNSISNNRIWTIVEQTDGTLWIGTDDGLNKFNPQTEIFTRYKHDPQNSNSLSHNRVQGLYLDDDKILWIATKHGLNKFDLDTETFKHYFHDPDDPHSISHNVIYIIHEDRYGTFWIGTNGGGLNKFDPITEKFTSYQHNPADQRTISHNDIRALCEDKSANLWIGTRGGGLNKIDLKLKKFTHYKSHPDDPNSLSNDRVFAIHEDESKTLWIGTDGGGLNKLNRDTEIFTVYRHDPNDPNSLSNDRIRTLYIDKFGSMWIGTYRGGLNRFDLQSKNFTRYLHDENNPNSLSNERVNTIFGDKSGILWIGTDEGLNRLDIETQTFTHYKHDPEDFNSLSHNSILSVYKDSSDALWVGTWGGGLNKIKFVDDTMEVSHFRYDLHDENSLSNNEVFCIHEDQRGNLWIGTRGGLNKLDLNEANSSDDSDVQFSRYLKTDGLPGNMVFGILEDGNGNLWLSTASGLSKFNPQTEEFRNYDEADGLQSNEFAQGSYHKGDDGEMFFGGINGFNAFYPEDVKANPHIPPVVITAFKIFDKEVNFDKTISEIHQISLSYKDDFFSFEFAALDYTNMEKNQYAYKLDGFDKDWIYSGSRRYASYTNLGGGNYTLRVRGSNNDGVWNEDGASIKIKISPPPWKTWWAYSLYFLSIVLVIYGYVHYKNQKSQRQIEQERLKREMEIAEKIQTSLVPPSPTHEELDIAVVMKPAAEVGGDYYDIIFDKDDVMWVAIGDVSGHGVTPGLIMMMAQTSFNTDIKQDFPVEITPRDAIIQVNKILCENIRLRLKETHFMTMTFLKYQGNGEFTHSGLHLEIIIYRQQQKKCEIIESKGIFLGLLPDISHIAENLSFKLDIGDILFLYTDGVIEARNENDELLEPEGLVEIIEQNAQQNVETLKDIIVERALNWCNHKQADDIALIIMKRKK